jgi:hypothetical protein
MSVRPRLLSPIDLEILILLACHPRVLKKLREIRIGTRDPQVVVPEWWRLLDSALDEEITRKVTFNFA